ncbi:MAG: SCO family protein [Hyphomicrobium sp.]|nr:SCO family protein [Hyphomicrobium sp.]
MNGRTIGLVLAGLIAGGAIAAISTTTGFGPPPGGSKAVVTGKPLIGGPFTLTDHTGKRVTEKDFLGRYALVFFGFTHCPDICPSGLQVMTAALDKIGAKASDVVPVFITLDSARDTPSKLAEYLKSFHPRLVGLSGSAEELAAAAKSYRVYYQKIVDEKSPDSYSFDHSAMFYLMGKDGVFMAPIPHTTNVDELARALDAALP